ncbi:MAG: hypothetical protein KGN80_12240 [Acidobacteriota bacterium]|nr:hypothetical protein [Acidobacteriota bacterium]
MRIEQSEAHACCTPIAKAKAPASCPACGIQGKPVKPLTLRSLLQPHLRSQVQDEVYRFCASPSCALVYYSTDGSQTYARADLTVRVGVKEASAPRPLCYCFGQSAESIREEWVRTGKSTVADSIKAEVKAGNCQCELTNPSGACCLGDVIKEVKAVTASALPSPKSEEGSKRTVWASIGLGVLASACCWVPLALAGVGVATGTLGARIAWIRPWALSGLLILLLGVIGWWVRRRFASAETMEGCCAVVPRFPTLAVTILVFSFLFAWATPRLLHPGRNSSLTAQAPTAPAGETLLVISTPQFDCPPCVGNLPQTMADTPGVASVQMDFDKRETHISFQPGAAIDTTLAQWKKDLGFDGKQLRREAASAPTHGTAGR